MFHSATWLVSVGFAVGLISDILVILGNCIGWETFCIYLMKWKNVGLEIEEIHQVCQHGVEYLRYNSFAFNIL